MSLPEANPITDAETLRRRLEAMRMILLHPKLTTIVSPQEIADAVHTMETCEVVVEMVGGPLPEDYNIKTLDGIVRRMSDVIRSAARKLAARASGATPTKRVWAGEY